MAETQSVGSGATKSELEEDNKIAPTEDDASKCTPPPSGADPAGEREDDDASEMLEAFRSSQDTQSWRWEQQWVEIERSFVAPPLRLKKWVRVPAEGKTPSKNRTVTVETGRDGTKILVGGFMEYYCPHPGCGKVFPSMGSLRKHMHIHGEKQFVCPIENCGKRFLDNSKLKRHMAIHTRDPLEETPLTASTTDPTLPL